jgi:RimJ/RimL family protein N-acetyltransferase
VCQPFVAAVKFQLEMRTIRTAQVNDAEMLCEAERKVVRAHDGLLVSEANELLPASFSERIANLADGRGKYLVAEVGSGLVGHASLWPMGLRKVSHVLRLDMCIHLGFWRQGHGEALLGALLQWAGTESLAHKVELLVRSENLAAISLYRKFGFIEEGRMKNRVRLSNGRFIDDISMAVCFER